MKCKNYLVLVLILMIIPFISFAQGVGRIYDGGDTLRCNSAGGNEAGDTKIDTMVFFVDMKNLDWGITALLTTDTNIVIVLYADSIGDSLANGQVDSLWRKVSIDWAKLYRGSGIGDSTHKKTSLRDTTFADSIYKYSPNLVWHPITDSISNPGVLEEFYPLVRFAAPFQYMVIRVRTTSVDTHLVNYNNKIYIGIHIIGTTVSYLENNELFELPAPYLVKFRQDYAIYRAREPKLSFES